MQFPFGPDYHLGQRINGLLPNIKASFGGLVQYGPSGAVVNIGTQNGNVSKNANQIAQWDFNASRSSQLYVDGVENVIPSSCAMYYIIKY